jgi:hypothetical protein
VRGRQEGLVTAEWSDEQINDVVNAYVCTNSEIGFQEENFMAQLQMPRMKHKGKHIPYGPKSKGLIQAIRKELRRLIDEPDLDLGRIGHMALQADDLLSFTSTPEDVMRGKQAPTIPVAWDPNLGGGVMSSAETYGATVIRELVPALKSMLQGQKETPDALVYAIATARREGMTDLAAELEQKLVGKRLDGKRPIEGRSTVEDYLPVTSASVEGIREEGRAAKRKGKKPVLTLTAGPAPGWHRNANGDIVRDKPKKKSSLNGSAVHS